MTWHMKGARAGLAAAMVMMIALALPAAAAPAAAPVDRIDRLLGLARIWAEVKYFHPAMFQRAIDWDGALIQVLPEVEAASDADIGYVDLTRLTTDEIDAMYETLRATRAIVFDMRGYPHGTGALITQRIHTRSGNVRAEFLTPLVTARTAGSRATIRVLQRFLGSDKPIYREKIVVLIDDRAISAGEHTCLGIEAASDATFIGSPTDGTNGEETYVRLPGGLELRFTGQEVRHADGRQLQQIGIQPQITVRPTLRGLRAGKDEVLDRAIHYIQTGK